MENDATRNLLLTLRFDGSAFHGWQVQPNGYTVQQALQEAAAQVCGAPRHVAGCSRTDAGVHAAMFCCSVHWPGGLPCEKIVLALNYYLPPQVVVTNCREVPPEFHARYDCKGKTYGYHVRNSRVRDPFLRGRALLEPFALDAALLHAQAQALIGAHDFAAFCAAGGGQKTTVRTVRRFEVLRDGDDVRFFVAADGFLYHMVRIMVGTLLDIAKGKLPKDCIPGILLTRNRSNAGVTAPPEGLWLVHVEY
jgi:tRNA pseudouridine38-40 synthase